MSSEILKRDQNSAVVLGGITDDASQEIRMLRVDAATGRLLVSSTGGGGGGFTTLSSTETPNGVRTTFTFPSATGQPTFLVIDNAMTRATTKTGLVNWTWSGTVATLTGYPPPVEDIVGIQ